MFMAKVYAEAVTWRAAFGALVAGRVDLLGGEAGVDAVTSRAASAGRMPLAIICQLRHAIASGSIWHWLKQVGWRQLTQSGFSVLQNSSKAAEADGQDYPLCGSPVSLRSEVDPTERSFLHGTFPFLIQPLTGGIFCAECSAFGCHVPHNSHMRKPSSSHNWYVYKYVDPRPEMSDAVIYIGKGTHKGDGNYLKRMRTHWQATSHKNQLFRRVLDKIEALGLAPEISVVSWHDSEQGALDAEIANICAYGLRRNGGTLCNLTLGGEGTEGFIHTEEEKAKVAEASKLHWESNEYRAKRGASLRKYIGAHPEELAIRAAKSAAAWTDEGRAAHAESVRNRGPEFGAKVSASLRANPEFLRKASEIGRTVLQDSALIARRKVTLKQTMADPEFRRQLSARTSKGQTSKGHETSKGQVSHLARNKQGSGLPSCKNKQS